MLTFAQHVGHAQERTLQATLQHQDRFSSVRTNSMKHVVLTKIMEGGLFITGMEPQLPSLVMEKTSRSAARWETAMNQTIVSSFAVRRLLEPRSIILLISCERLLIYVFRSCLFLPH